MMRPPFRPPAHAKAFVLLEAMLAVAIFAIGVIALGRCISQGLAVERLSAEDTRALRILENRAAEIEGGAVPAAAGREQIPGINGGVALTETIHPAHKRDEKGQELTNLFLVTLEAAWQSDGARQARTLDFYVWIP
jgi:hypothetical protein